MTQHSPSEQVAANGADKGVWRVFVSASSRCFAELPFFEACPLMADLEFDKVEIWLADGSEHLQPADVAADPDAFATQYRDITRLTPVAFFLGCDVPPAVLGGIAKAAKLLRAAQVTVPASPLGTPFNTEVDRLRDFVARAGADGVRVSIKTQTGFLSEDPRTAVELCQAVPGLGITLDPSYYICGPHAGESFDQIYPHVYHVHLRDTSPQAVQVPVGLGEVDYSRLITHLEKVRYRLALSVDFETSEMSTETRQLEMRKLRMLLDSLL